jgi:hypothetical protein
VPSVAVNAVLTRAIGAIQTVSAVCLRLKAAGARG